METDIEFLQSIVERISSYQQLRKEHPLTASLAGSDSAFETESNERSGTGTSNTHKRARFAAVALVLRASTEGLQILFIRRAVNPRDPWSGHVALPGGRWEPADGPHLRRTAARETFEEVGLLLDEQEDWVGALDDVYIWSRNMVVSPHVFVLKSPERGNVENLRLDPKEVYACRWVCARSYILAQELQMTRLWSGVNVLSSSMKLSVPFPGLQLSGPLLDLKVASRSVPLDTEEEEDDDEADGDVEFILWGLTLRVVHSFVDAVDDDNQHPQWKQLYWNALGPFWGTWHHLCSPLWRYKRQLTKAVKWTSLACVGSAAAYALLKWNKK